MERGRGRDGEGEEGRRGVRWRGEAEGGNGWEREGGEGKGKGEIKKDKSCSSELCEIILSDSTGMLFCGNFKQCIWQLIARNSPTLDKIQKYFVQLLDKTPASPDSGFRDLVAKSTGYLRLFKELFDYTGKCYQ